MAIIPYALLALLFPAMVQILREKVKSLSFLNPLITSYAMGIVLGNTVLRGQAAFSAFDLMATLSVALSIPLMLFTLDVRSWGKTTGKVMLGMVLASVSVVIAVGLGMPLFAASLPSYPELAGLMVGVYTGGTPNLAALRIALDVDNDLYLAVHAADVALGALYILFFISVAKRLFGRFLKTPELALTESTAEEHPGRELYDSTLHSRFPFIGDIIKKSPKLGLSRNAGLTLLVIAAAFGLSLLLPNELQTMVVILGITTFAIALSFIKPIRDTPGSFAIGEYFILVFSFSAGAMGDVRRILGASPLVFLLVAYVLIASMIIHIMLSKLFKLDRNTVMISSTAAICSPPFVGLVAGVVGDSRLIAPGITAGIVGYAVGNYLGVIVAKLLSLVG
ncbi:MAG: DUF819 family protein [Spirochaetia bacterium]|jgi:uncharacterized membrane protein|nr:DUF819 family protein [Spirochaetia bacterium]